MLRLSFFLLLLTLSVISRAESCLYDTRQLSSNLITALCQDKQGYIWIGTEYGLNKFDGAHVTQYHNDDTNPYSLSDDIIRCMMTDRDGFVWVVNNHGVQRYNRNTDVFESVRFEEGTSANIYDILQTPKGHIWLLSSRAGVLEVDDDMQAKPIETINKHVKANCGNMLLDSKGRLWIGYSDSGIQFIDTKTYQTHFYNQITADIKRAARIIEDDNHRLFIITTDAIFQYNERDKNFESIVTYPRNTITASYYDHHGHLLFGTSGSGLWKADINRREVTQIDSNDSEDAINLTHAKINAIMEDHNGNLWVGCYQKGLLKVSDKTAPFRYLPLNKTEKACSTQLRSVFADKEGHVYLCQERCGIRRINHDGQCLSHWMDGYTVMSIYEDGEGTFWVGTFRNGLFHVNPQTGKEEWMALTNTQRIGSITQDKQGNLYTAVFNSGLHSYTPDGQTERVLGKGELKLTNIFPNKLFTDHDGRIWIGHYYGIDIYDPQTDQLVDIPIDAALRPAIVYAIDQSADGSIWIGSSKGLFRYNANDKDNSPWKRFTTRNGLPNDVVCGLVITDDGTIWISTYRGLGRIEQDGTITSFLPGGEQQDAAYLRSAYARSSNGEIIMGLQNGITWFSPEHIGKQQFERGITLTGIRLGNINVNASTLSDGKAVISKPLEMTDEITVSYQDNTLSLLFSSMDYRNVQNVHYEYRFEDESEKEWHHTPVGTSEVYLSRLSVGCHRLQVRAYDNGVWSDVKTLIIHITPPWYRSWWAYMFYVLIAVIIAGLWWRSYWNKRQAEINEEKIKFFVDISHELRSPLTLIKSPLEQLLKSNQDPTTIRALRNMERSTNRLLTLTDQILSIRKMEKGQLKLRFTETRLSDFIADICHDYDYQVELRQLTLSFNNQAPELTAWIDLDQFDKVVANLLGNAIKFVDDGGEITVTLRQTADNKAELSICDNGPGIDEEKLQKLFERFYQASLYPSGGQMSYGVGLNLTKKIVDLHGGTITARNRSEGKGSEFIVRLPLGCKHLPQQQLAIGETYSIQSTKNISSTISTDEGSLHRTRRKTDYRVAIVDDDEDMRNFLKTELDHIYHVYLYPDGQKALEGITDTLPDIVISDVVMPEINGIELLKRMKSNTKTCHIPIILLTSKTDHQSHIKGIEEGADAYFDKPFNMDELEASITSIINNRNLIRGKFSGLQEQTDTVRKIELKGNDAALMEKIMKAVNDRLDDSDFNVETLAEDVGLSRAQLHRRMKDLTGVSVGEFIRNLRLQQAARLLKSDDISISQVTYAIGFSTPAHFTVAFKKYFGITPSEYMAKYANKTHEGDATHADS